VRSSTVAVLSRLCAVGGPVGVGVGVGVGELGRLRVRVLAKQLCGSVVRRQDSVVRQLSLLGLLPEILVLFVESTLR